jgi:hypothetical protein
MSPRGAPFDSSLSRSNTNVMSRQKKRSSVVHSGPLPFPDVRQANAEVQRLTILNARLLERLRRCGGQGVKVSIATPATETPPPSPPRRKRSSVIHSGPLVHADLRDANAEVQRLTVLNARLVAKARQAEPPPRLEHEGGKGDRAEHTRQLARVLQAPDAGTCGVALCPYALTPSAKAAGGSAASFPRLPVPRLRPVRPFKPTSRGEHGRPHTCTRAHE